MDHSQTPLNLSGGSQDNTPNYAFANSRHTKRTVSLARFLLFLLISFSGLGDAVGNRFRTRCTHYEEKFRIFQNVSFVVWLERLEAKRNYISSFFLVVYTRYDFPGSPIVAVNILCLFCILAWGNCLPLIKLRCCFLQSSIFTSLFLRSLASSVRLRDSCFCSSSEILQMEELNVSVDAQIT